MKWESFNLNDRVRFRLTEKGRQHIAHLNATDFVYKQYPLSFKEDKDGWCETELWDLAHHFGALFYNGCNVPIETSFQIRCDTIEETTMTETKEIERLRHGIDCACNALTDSILCSGNDGATNMHFVRKLRNLTK